VLDRVRERFQACKLELHSGKTRIVYYQDINRNGEHPDVQFTFLGYTFRPRKAVDKYGRVYVNFSPAVSRDALKAMRQAIRGWHLQLKSDKSLDDLLAMFDPALRGWQQYYGHFYGSALKPGVAEHEPVPDPVADAQDRADGIHRFRLDHPGLAGLKVNRAVNVQTLAAAAMLLKAIEAMYPNKRLIHLFVVRQAKLARSSR
jgi:hypothetical protein